MMKVKFIRLLIIGLLSGILLSLVGCDTHNSISYQQDASSGSLEKIYGQNNAAGGSGSDIAYGVAATPDGGWITVGRSFNGSNDDMAVWKFTASGKLDMAINGTGIVVDDNAAGGNGDDSAAKVAIFKDGGWIVIGKSQGTNSSDLVVWKFLKDGSLDDAFYSGGKFVYPDSSAYGVAILEDGSWIVTGQAASKMLTLKFTVDGILDDSFYSNGVYISDISANKSSGSSIAPTADGGWLIFGSIDNYPAIPASSFVLWKFLSNGILDDTYYTNGVNIVANTLGDEYISDIAELTDGSWIVVGSGFGVDAGSKMQVLVRKFSKDGNLVTSFSNNGTYLYGSDASSFFGVHRYSLSVTATQGGGWMISGYVLGNEVGTSLTYESTMFALRYGKYGILQGNEIIYDSYPGEVSADFSTAITTLLDGSMVLVGASSNALIDFPRNSLGFPDSPVLLVAESQNYNMSVWRYTVN